jgi:Arc/MetJ-type ribon-helix-helix transcriptional regulator
MSIASISISDQTKAKVKKLVNSGKFGNSSEVYRLAIEKFLAELEYKEYLEKEIQEGIRIYEQKGTVNVSVEDIIIKSKTHLKRK